MSGICAIVHFDGREADSAALGRMAAAAAFRGPDGVRLWHDAGTALAHLALHVAPEDVLERQPLLRAHHALVADARIDNRDELIPLLRAKGELSQATPSDAELILAAHLCWGHDAPARLIGDFAYAIVDTRSHQLFAARDPMGMRVLHFHATPRRLVLATEILQLLVHPDVPVELNEARVAAHLAGPHGEPGTTFYAGIHQLPPGHALEAGADGHRTWRFWDIDPAQRVQHRSEDDYAEHLLELLRTAVAARMRTHRPIGLFLSGGLDSGAVGNLLGHLRATQPGPPIHAFSWAFREPALQGGDERDVSGRIVRHYGLTGHDVDADDMWPLQGYPDHGPHRDEPFTFVYQALHDRTLAAARQSGVVAMFRGDRGDEMVGDWVFDHPGLLWSGQWRTLLRELRAHGAWHGRSLRSVLRRDLAAPLLDDLTRRSPRPPGDIDLTRRLPPYVRADWARSVGLVSTLHASATVAPPLATARRRRYERVFFFRGLRDPAVMERAAARFGLAAVDPWSD
jgi:asparagine synthase (glutamine-hydrolysing)